MSVRRSPSPATAAALVVLVAYVIVRVASFPADLDVTRAVSHDSGYIGIVARNLLAGRGYVNDAHWLLFLDPPALPMYYHNANPLYPTMTAAVMAVSGAGPIASGAFLSILGTAFSAIGVFLLVRHFGVSERLAIACAAVPVLFPPLFRISFTVLPDALATGLTFCLLAMVVRAREWWHWVLAGALFGLAWLTRSTAVLVIPAIAVWVIGRRGVRNAVVAGALCAIGTLVVISPWLVRNAHVRGGPFVSDSSFYLLIDYFAKKGGRTPDELYRSISAPPAQPDLADLMQTAVAEVPETLTRSAAAIAQSNVAAAIVLLAAMLCGAWCVWHRRRGVELAAACVVFVTMVAAFAIRGDELEPRYLAVCFALLGLLMLAPFGAPVTRRTMWLRGPVLIYAAVFLGPQLWRITTLMRSPDPKLQVFQLAARSLHNGIADTSAVVTHLPYLFTLYTGRHAVSPPYPGKPELLRIMQRYHASHLFLPADRFAYYYRGGPASLAPELTAVAPRPHYLVLQRRPPTTHDLPRRSRI